MVRLSSIVNFGGARVAKYLEKTMIENWRRETQAARLYRLSAEREHDGRRRDILLRLADVEERHATLWADKLQEYDIDVSEQEIPAITMSAQGLSSLLTEIERIEQSNETWYASQRALMDENPDIVRILDEIDADEKTHESTVGAMFRTPKKELKRPESRRNLKGILRDERWHKKESSGWVGDAIYGVNDGLGAIFGIIAGVAGFIKADNTILISGLFGALASTLSMGAGAWLATKSENELMEAELEAERQEIEENPEHEIEELALMYELKGFEQAEAMRIARQIASDKDIFLKTMAAEELGIHETSKGNPWSSSLFGSASTLVGAIVPLIPFFFLHGTIALIVAAVVSIIAHFIVGALKSKITVRSWWASGFEMTLVGVLVGGVSYLLGELGSLLLK